jgi:macrodomain Ter protein organizer (MatP/YcbG family)
MITFEQLHAQNHKITELSNVFLYLINERSMCDTDIACSVFFDYVEKVRDHLEIVDKHLYTKLLNNPDQAVRQKADRFMSGSHEIKRLFNAYLGKWSMPGRKQLTVRNHKKFVEETRDIMDIVLDRIQRETEHLYPLVRRVTGEDKIAA